mmetsp:Transcript_30517/g.80966  ORF Transcript_30517/g.80966 Transcript_30517/m.80966 type:complete len:267 (+) Transcript_30517:659-1459(+)
MAPRVHLESQIGARLLPLALDVGQHAKPAAVLPERHNRRPDRRGVARTVQRRQPALTALPGHPEPPAGRNLGSLFGRRRLPAAAARVPATAAHRRQAAVVVVIVVIVHVLLLLANRLVGRRLLRLLRRKLGRVVRLVRRHLAAALGKVGHRKVRLALVEVLLVRIVAVHHMPQRLVLALGRQPRHNLAVRREQRAVVSGEEASRAAADEGVTIGAPRLALGDIGRLLNRTHRLLECAEQLGELGHVRGVPAREEPRHAAAALWMVP